MLTKDDIEQIGKLLQAQNEHTKQLIETSEKRLTEKLEKEAGEILDTVSQGFDGLQPVLGDLEKRVESIEHELHIAKN